MDPWNQRLNRRIIFSREKLNGKSKSIVSPLVSALGLQGNATHIRRADDTTESSSLKGSSSSLKEFMAFKIINTTSQDST